MTENVQYILTLQDFLSGKLTSADKEAKKLESTMGSLQSRVTGFGAAVVAGFAVAGVAAVGAFAAKVISAGTTVENARTGLTTLLKDSKEAGEVIENTMTDATKTPFAFEGLLAANKALIAAGVGAKEARADVLNLANAIAATGGGDNELKGMVVNMQQIKNAGKASAMDIKQFAFAGINIYKVLAEATGEPIEKIKDMEISYDMLTMALKKAHDAGGVYENGLENMAQNTSVRISNVGDAIFTLSVQMFQDLKPAIDAIITSMMGFVQTLASGWAWIVQNKEGFKTMAKSVMDVAVAVGILYGATKLYQATLVIQYAWTMRTALAEAFANTVKMTLTKTTGYLTAAQWMLNAALTANPIGVVVVGIAALAAGFVYLWHRSTEFRATLIGLWSVMKEFGNTVSEVFTGIYHSIHGIVFLDGAEIERGFAQTTAAMYNAGANMKSAFKKGYESTILESAAIAPPGATATKEKPKVDAAKPMKDISPKGATGQKITTINISINKLIEQFKISTTNMPESTSKVRELVAQTLLSAVNDSQITAGI